VSAKKKKTGTKPRRRTKSFPGWVGYLLLAAALLTHLLLVVQYNFTQDDAFITFRYANNFLDGHGLVYNIGERVEGYTNFLWTIFMILGGLIGIDMIGFSAFLGVACGLASIVLLFFTARLALQELNQSRRDVLAGLSCLILSLVYSFAYWTVAGLETAAFTLMVAAALYFYLKNSYLTVAALVLATLLRPEGGLVFFFIVIYEIISRRSFSRYALLIVAGYIIFLLPLAAFKLSYYHSLLPNPFYAKTSFDFRQMAHGLEYTGRYFWHYFAAGIFLVPALISIRKFGRPLRLIMIFLLVYTLYITLIGGDVLKVHRFFVPIMPLFALAAIAGLYFLFRGKPLFIFSIAVLAAWQLYIPKDFVDTFHGREKGFAIKMILLMNNLTAHDQSDFTVATSTIGMVGYKLMGHDVIDMLGLTDSTIARHPEPLVEDMESTWKEQQFNSRYLLSRRPDYILFSTGVKPSAPAERALFLYSAFLDHYRTIGFYLGTQMHPLYKRYGEIEDSIVRDVDLAFSENLNRAMNLVGESRSENIEALEYLEEALRLSPDPVFPYVYYFISEAHRNLGNIEASYKWLRRAASEDTLCYEIYKDLYFIEYRMGRHQAAQAYRERVQELVPWYIPRLDSLVTGMKR